MMDRRVPSIELMSARKKGAVRMSSAKSVLRGPETRE